MRIFRNYSRKKYLILVAKSLNISAMETNFYSRLSFFFLLIISMPLLAQEENTKKFYPPAIGANIGALTFSGDIGKNNKSSLYTNTRWGYGFFLEQKFGNIFGVQLNGLMGKLSKNETDTNLYRNFETPIMQFDLSLLFDFDNGKIINNTSGFAPFLSLGFGYMQFDPYTDALDENGSPYYVWKDGSLRDLPQSDTTLGIAKFVKRDYQYETQLTDSLVNYQRNTFTIPLRFGLKYKFSEALHARLTAAYFITMSDYIDNTALSGKDKFLYTSLSLQYNIGRKSKTEKIKEDTERYKNVDFNSLMVEDTDKDGVIDWNDKCSNTPQGVKVDKEGCPLDDDGDGVPNHLDEEPNTPSGNYVDDRGRTIKFEEIKNEDAIDTQKTIFYQENGEDKSIEEIKSNAPAPLVIPKEFKTIDFDSDGFISSQEVTKAIDDYFDGKNNMSVELLHKLVDFFFEQ
ncbi:MAG: hypothetical protein BroJett020_16690 [Bacteroidota bacterium]|nr:MAG: outer membrane beta-barrel protein [Vicingaceae bacterium]GIK70374.1 MAG: hypothetical protein BroJett020_16690 [Bacteroidota bacterium]